MVSNIVSQVTQPAARVGTVVSERLAPEAEQLAQHSGQLTGSIGRIIGSSIHRVGQAVKDLEDIRFIGGVIQLARRIIMAPINIVSSIGLHFVPKELITKVVNRVTTNLSQAEEIAKSFNNPKTAEAFTNMRTALSKLLSKDGGSRYKNIKAFFNALWGLKNAGLKSDEVKQIASAVFDHTSGAAAQADQFVSASEKHVVAAHAAQNA